MRGNSDDGYVSLGGTSSGTLAVTHQSELFARGDEGEGVWIRGSGLRSGGGLRWGSTSCRGEAAGAEAGWGEILPFLL